ncbi:hypothetical protein [Streptomyces sp. NBC_00624]|uniref:hypothetical protein n=1 Tax=Streptomyces sp. NBC_00624 TaxID=2975791 RepID=UPI002F90701F
MTTATPEVRAASLFAAVFNIVFEDDPRMTIALHEGNGSRQAVTGALTDDYEMRFDAAEVATLLTSLTRAVAYDRDAIITVAALADINGDHSCGWAWRIADGAPLDDDAAGPLFDPYTEHTGAEYPYITLAGDLVEPSDDGLSATALTDDVKNVITNHGGSPQPTGSLT